MLKIALSGLTLLALAVMSGCAAAPEAEEEEETTSVSSELTGCKTGLFVVRSNAYLRSAPNASASVVRTLYGGRVQVITMRPCATNGYYLVKVTHADGVYVPNGVSGWIRGDNL